MFLKKVTVLLANISCLLIIFCCSETSFKGQNTKKETKKPFRKEDSQVEVAISSETSTEKSVENGAEGDAIEVNEEKEDIKIPVCEINPDYDPEDIKCSINVNENSVWANVDIWAGGSAAFQDRTANWIGPLDKSYSDSKPAGWRCAGVPGNEMLLYISHFKVENPGNHTIEILNDNNGYIRLWQNSDPKKEMVKHLSNNNYDPTTVNLEKGIHSIVIDSADYGGVSGMIMSIKDSNGKMVKNTALDGSWCVFRTTANTDVVEFVIKAAACRFCFHGIKK